MRILVTGREGQVAASLAERARSRSAIDLSFAARPEVDLAVPGAFAAAIEAARPDLVINAAAFTAVDRAEQEEALAFRINAEAAGEGAEMAGKLGIAFIQLSTDYVFDGTPGRPWREDDPVAPLSAYGRTKAEGERRVLAALGNPCCVRTSWIVSPFGHNFVRTMLRLAAERDEIAVVADQRGRPTSALDLADALLDLADPAAAGEAGGIWHIANGGDASWAELAEEIMRVSRAAGGPNAVIRPIASADYPTPAQRPANSVLDCTKARDRAGISLPDWRDAVGPIVRRLVTA
jgi:dTDP-4-dehydrorhamnose reductase